MDNYKIGTQSARDAQALSYQSMALTELVERIVRSSDRLALGELHDHRTLFRFRGGRPMLLAEFVEALRSTSLPVAITGHSHDVLERAYDITIDKFTSLPENLDIAVIQKTTSPDCRYYFQAFLQLMIKWIQDNPAMIPLKKEIKAAQILQHLVVRHFRFSCMEAKRSSNLSRSRYTWHVNGGLIYVQMPNQIPGRQRRIWLDANVENPDPTRPDEKRRVQEIIDERLGVPKHESLGDNEYQLSHQDTSNTPIASLIQEEINVHGLAKVVAGEKAENLHSQRPAIQSLGRTKLKKLILRIFENLSEGHHAENKLADEFGLSKATYSRFAGSQWKGGSAVKPPDLWTNVALTLARHETFMETAKEAGVWKNIERILQESQSTRVRRRTDV
jgi:hypothetical protein